MPKLPGTREFGLAQAPMPNPQLAPSNVGLGAVPQRMAGAAAGAARQPNLPQVVAAGGIDLSDQIIAAERVRQAREDAIARSVGRAQYFQEADELMLSSEPTITTKDGMDVLVKSLDETRKKAIDNYAGSPEGREMFAAQLLDAHGEYMRRALTTRSEVVKEQFKAELGAAADRLSMQVYQSPALLDDKLQAAEVYIDDMSTSMSPAQVQAFRRDMQSQIAFSAIDSLLNAGDFREADLMRQRVGGMLTGVQQSNVDRRIRALVAEATAPSAGREMTHIGGGVMTDKEGGFVLPPAEVSEYLRQQSAAGAPKVTIAQQVESEASKRQVGALFDEAKTYRELASRAEENAVKAEQIDKLLEGIPTGTFPAEVRKRVSELTGINQEELSDIQTANKLSVDLVLEEIRKMAPVSDSDRRYVEKGSPGFWQTPEGRKGVVYIMKRQAEFARRMQKVSGFAGRMVSEGRMTPGRAAQRVADYETELRREFSSTFSPPQPKAKAEN